MAAAMMPAKPVVLAVDDKRANLIALRAILEDAYDVLFASSGPEAIEAARRNPPIDIILMDVQMPGMDGFEAAKEIKKLPDAKDIPIIFVTAVYTEDPHVRMGYEAGGIDYFSKPFDPEILRLKLRVYSAFRTRDRILQERELHVRESEELLRVGRKLSTMLESLRVGVMIADAEGRICQTTQEVARILKSAPYDESGAYGELLSWWDRAGRRMKGEGSPLGKALKGETSHSEPVEVRCIDDSTITIVVSASPLRGLDGRLVGAVLLIKDVTEPRKIEEALEERVARLVGAGLELEESATRPR